MNKRQKYVVFLLVLVLLSTWGNYRVFSEELAPPTVSIVFIQDDLRDAITELVLQTGVNIIIDDTVHGLVTLDLVDVPLEKALSMMLMPGGYEFIKSDGFYFVGSSDPRNTAFKHLAQTETINLQYISAAKARELLPQSYEPYLRSSSEGNILTITAPTTIIEQFRQDLRVLDVPAPQILIQALVTEIASSELAEWGSKLLSYHARNQQETGDSSWLDHAIYDNTVFNFGFFGKVLTSLQALEAEKKAEIKANPRVIVTNGETVDLFSGDTHFLLLSNSSSSRLEEVNVGVSLNVTPRVANDETLQIDIKPEISHIAAQPLNKNEGFAVRRSAIHTNIYAESGQALLLAGLTLQQDSNENNRVPILGKIPLIRWLFSSKSSATEERELLIFITAEIL